MGEDRIHNKLILGQFAIVAVYGGWMQLKHFEVMRNYIGRKLKKGKSFAFYRVDPPFKPITSHGAGKKLGGGKGSVKTYCTPVKAGRVILEVGGNVYWEEVRMWYVQRTEKCMREKEFGLLQHLGQACPNVLQQFNGPELFSNLHYRRF